NNRQIGALGLFQIDPRANLTRVENSGVVPDRPATPALDFAKVGVHQGYIERANVNPVLEMTKLIMVQHAFETVVASIKDSDAAGVTVKPFEATLRAGLGATAWRRGFVTLNPHASWKGRTVNALGAPVDGCGPLQQGERPVSTEREPPAPMRRQRIRTPVKTG